MFGVRKGIENNVATALGSLTSLPIDITAAPTHAHHGVSLIYVRIKATLPVLHEHQHKDFKRTIIGCHLPKAQQLDEFRHLISLTTSAVKPLLINYF